MGHPVVSYGKTPSDTASSFSGDAGRAEGGAGAVEELRVVGAAERDALQRHREEQPRPQLALLRPGNMAGEVGSTD